MILKKLSALSSLLLIIAMLGHMITLGSSLATGGFCSFASIFTRAVFVLIICHGLLGVASVFFSHDGSSLGRYAAYNVRTIIQRASALAIVVLIHFHRSFLFATSSGTESASAATLELVVQLLFLAVVLSHVAVSLSRAFITLGLIRKESTERTLDLVTYIACAVAFIAAAIVFVKFSVPFIAMGA